MKDFLGRFGVDFGGLGGWRRWGVQAYKLRLNGVLENAIKAHWDAI